MPLTNYILKYLSQSFLVLKFVFPWSLFRHEMISTSKDLFQFAQVQKGHGVNITTEYQTAEVFGVMYSEKKLKIIICHLYVRNSCPYWQYPA